MPITLPKDADALLCVLYREYLTRRMHRIPIDQAAYFGNAARIKENFLPGWLPQDIVTACRWLARHELISALFAEDSVYEVQLDEAGLVYMETRFGQKAENVAKWITELAQLILSPLK